MSEVLYKMKHVKYCLRVLKCLPPSYSSHDSARVPMAYLSVCGLDVLNALDLMCGKLRADIINWIYRLQIIPQKNSPASCGGFEGGSSLNVAGVCDDCGLFQYKNGHLGMTYLSLAVLITLGDDLSRLDRKAIIEGIAAMQHSNGSFSPSVSYNEHDMRYVWFVSAICTMLDDWSGVNKIKMAEYVRRNIRYDYGISQHYAMESHGGITFCAIAALELSNQMNVLRDEEREKIMRWLVFRQIDGFQGRPNKRIDTCYSFWIGAPLKILNAFHLTNYEKNRQYVLSMQNSIVGGISKNTDLPPDPFHTYFGLCGLSFINEPDILEVMPSLNISMRAYERLKSIHKNWRLQSRFIDLNID